VSWYPVFIYMLSFSAACLFAYGAYRVIKDIQQVPIEGEGWFGSIADSSISGNPLFQVMMFVVRLLARINVTRNLGAYEIMLKKKLDAAGRPWDLKPTEYLGIKEASAILFCLLSFGLYLLVPGFSPALIFLIGVLGFLLPNAFVNRQIKERQLSILQDLPFCCDLLTMAVEAGLDFGGALERVVANGPPGPLRDEFHMVVQEAKIGKTRKEAFTDFSDRVHMQEISNFVGSIIQADRMGTGFAAVLRIQSGQIRSSRFERAEKAAQKVPVKILFPIIVANLLSIAIILVIPLMSAISDIGI
jgi:tight adherence protein C